MKYNANIQNDYSHFPGYFQIKDDNDTVVITNKKPIYNNQEIFCDHNQVKNFGFEDENLLEIHQEEELYKLSKSSIRFKLSELKGFLFGPFCTRFWMHRKGINSQTTEKNWPFYAWDCITLELSHNRQLSLVIQNEDRMRDFIRLILHKTKS